MVSTSTMNNFPSPWRLNYAGEVVRDVDVEETLHKVSPERKTFFSSDADAKSTTNKGKRESWFRIATKSNEKGDGTSNFPSIENLLDNMQCISCGPVGENTGDGKKKNRFLPTLNISRNGRKRTNDDKSKKETKKDQASFTKDVRFDCFACVLSSCVCYSDFVACLDYHACPSKLTSILVSRRKGPPAKNQRRDGFKRRSKKTNQSRPAMMCGAP